MKTRLLSARETIAAIARLLGTAGSDTLRIGGAVGFRVRGTGGGVWVVNLSVPGGDWRYNDEASFSGAAVRLTVDEQVFGEVIREPEDLDEAERRGQVMVEGERQRWLELAALLATSGVLLPAPARRVGRDGAVIAARRSHATPPEGSAATAFRDATPPGGLRRPGFRDVTPPGGLRRPTSRGRSSRPG